MSIKTLEDLKNIYYINLDHRTDRREHVETQLDLIGLKGQRFKAIKMENGAIGCSMSHLKLLQDAFKNKLEHIMIIEDDITFLDPVLFKKQINQFLKLHDKWDVLLLAGNNIPPYEKIDDTCIKVLHCQTTTGYIVNGHYIEKLMNNIKTGLTYLLNKPNERINYAIDRYWFHLQEYDNWYLLTPLIVIQREDYSDIEQRVTNYQSLMQDLDKRAFFKKTRK